MFGRGGKRLCSSCLNELCYFDSAAGQTDETAASGLGRLIRRVPSSKLRGSPVVQALVLILDDEPQMRRRLASALASFGYRSLHVGTMGAPLTRGGGHQPDLVIVDVSQPDGVGLTARLRDWTSAPILALLVHGREKERVELLDAGASDYLVKPFATEDLLGRVRVLLEGRACAKAARPALCDCARTPDRRREASARRRWPRGSPHAARAQAPGGPGAQPGPVRLRIARSLRRRLGVERRASAAVPVRAASSAQAENRGRSPGARDTC